MGINNGDKCGLAESATEFVRDVDLQKPDVEMSGGM